MPPETPAPPVAPQVPTTRTHHGDTFVDPYEWLRDKESPDTTAYLEAENAYTRQMTAHLAGLRGEIFEEIKARTQETDLSVPSRRGSHWYYSRTIEGSQYPLMCRVPAAGSDDWEPPEVSASLPAEGEQVLVDCNALAAGHEFFSLGAFAVSTDGALLAYSTDVVGDERYTVRVKRLDTGEHLPDEIPGTVHDVAWSTDDRFLFYTTVDAAWRPDKVRRHRVGTPGTEDDVCVHHETDERFWVFVHRTTSDRFLVIQSGSRVTSEARILDAANPTGTFDVVVPRREGVEYTLDHAVIAGADRWLVLHNASSPDFALGIGDLALHSLDHLQPVIEPADGVRLVDVHAARENVVVGLREGGLAQVRVFPVTADGLGEGRNVTFEESMFTAHAAGFSDWHEPSVRLTYESWVTPSTVLDHDPGSGGLVVRKRQPVLGYDPARLVQRREWVRSRDGVDIPISIVHHVDVEPRSRGPLLLYGYGSYEISMDPSVRIPRLSLLERGMVYVTAHVRGGGELGRGWYDHGKLLEKRHTFDDFVDCARHLVDTGWTTPEHLVAQGGSAGGLLIGAVANDAPELFAGLVAQVPFVDALTTILDPSLPLTVIEWDEWGDPLHDPDVYAYLKSYTPYENVRAVDYPAIYALTSINDTRVLYVEPAKWVARLRATARTGRPILLKCEMSAGHGGASGRYDAWREIADHSAWVVDVSGASHQPLHPLGPAS